MRINCNVEFLKILQQKSEVNEGKKKNLVLDMHQVGGSH